MRHYEDEISESWIMEGPSAALLKKVEEFGKRIGKDLSGKQGVEKGKDQRVTRSQIRQLYIKMKNIESKGVDNQGQWLEFLMFKPHLAYAAKRGNTTGFDELKKVLDKALDTVLTVEDNKDERKRRFHHFCKLFEAILAYHRAYGGN